MSIFLIPESLGDEIQKMMNSYWWGSNGNGSKGINWLSWDKLSVSKKFGGMGFRNLYAFNLSMLGKQGRRLLTNPNNLTSRLLKAKYFPRSDFMNAKLVNNPSLSWRSIWSYKALIKEGYKWNVGSGENVNIWWDPWIGTGETLLDQLPTDTSLHAMHVRDLVIHGTIRWNFQLVSQIMSPTTTEAIKQVPLLNSVSRFGELGP